MRADFALLGREEKWWKNREATAQSRACFD